jgi:hypothetical protein
MNPLILVAIRCCLMFLVPTVTYGISAQWDLDPISGDWNTATNWTPNGVPNGPGDIATFGLSNTTDVSISTDTEVNGIKFTAAAKNPYHITVSSGLTLTISGSGIVNNSGTTQTIETGSNGSSFGGKILFTGRSTAGNAFINQNEDGFISFNDNSNAGKATFAQGNVEFNDSSSAGQAVIQGTGGISVFQQQLYCGQSGHWRGQWTAFLRG